MSDKQWKKEFREKFHSKDDSTCTWHRNSELIDFISQVEERAEKRGYNKAKRHVLKIIENGYYLDVTMKKVKSLSKE